MYSMVLMMALGGGAAAPADHHGCVGSGGCAGVVMSHGCGGGGGHRLFGGGGHKLFGGGGGCHGGGHKLFGGHHGSRGCSSSAACSGYSTMAACSGSYGCAASSGCHGGGHKLFGGLFNRGHGGHGCHNGSYASHGCYNGGHAGYGCASGTMMHHGSGAPAMAPAPTKKTMPAAEPVGKPAKQEEARLNTTATMIVSIPAEAQLTIDGKATSSATTTRVFVTPELEVGQTYRYTLQAVLVREGQSLTTSKEVTVRAGEETRVSIEFSSANVVSR